MAQFDNTFNTERMQEIRQDEEEHLITQLALQYGYQYVDLHGVTIDPRALLTIPEATARTANIVAFEQAHKKLTVAIRNPNNPNTKELLAKLGKKWQLNIVMTSTTSLEHAWKRYKDQKKTTAVRRGVLDINPDEIEGLMSKFKSREDVQEHIQEIRTVNSARRVSQTLEAVFAGALALGASDIHIEPEEGGIRLRYRLDGVLQDIVDLERIIYERLMSRLKLLSGVRLNVHNEAQDGRFTFDVTEKVVEVRSSIIPGADGESMVMRLLDPSVASFSMENLGINSALKAILEKELTRPNGLIITTGPTGSGKTTALYAFLREAHNSEVKIITIEDPVEYKLDDIVQTQVSDGYTFASGLRAVLRQDPDIIMVGEIRDREVAETAIHAAQTGHLVFSTLHTNSAVGAFPRLIDLGVDYRTLGSAINLILGQRLLRILCEHCKTTRPATPSETELIESLLSTHPNPPSYSSPFNLYEPVGCPHCNDSGYKGRQAIFEAVQVDEAVEEAVSRDPREHTILEAARPQGIPAMAEDGVEKILDGVSSLAELQRVVDLSGRGVREEADEAEPEDGGFSAHIV